MNNKVLINSGNINSKVLITGKKVKYIEEPEQLQWNELKKTNKQQQHQQQQTIKLIISIDKTKDNIKQINR